MISSDHNIMITNSGMLGMALIAAICSFVVSILIVLTERWHGNHSLDMDMTGAQKFHKKPVPRIGGIALLMGILGVIVFGMSASPSEGATNDTDAFSKLLLAVMPAFIAGLLEDLTKSVSVISRLLATFASALIACWLLDAYLPRLDIWGVDTVLQVMPVAIVFTAFAVAGVANSINVIDGFNGLAGGTAVIILAGMGFLAWQAGDVFVAKLAIVGIGATIGFLFLNYPTGRLFMGDGGAYLLGFWIAEVAVLTVARNPSINTWQILAICAYPIIEVLYSIYRKKVIRKMSPGLPDRLHFHMLVYRRFIWRLVPANSMQSWVRNAMVACVVVTWIAPLTLLSVHYGRTIPGAVGMLLIELSLYLVIYARLVRGHWCPNPAVGFGLLPEHRAKSR